MKKIAKFEKVSYNQFKNDFMDSFPQYNEKEVEENLSFHPTSKTRHKKDQLDMISIVLLILN